ncbi:hypothetical protein BGZ95_008917 [Linnemannia exigua]|uniref:Uncharacterized protein n=1 Tax=Linnemannia exigua TaxID=604196 RepID=A0AAD4H709_9FUNG|nr:hypothetical protein BGZ95_008917 [Linnemannia exigua]
MENNNQLKISTATDMDLDEPMPLMSPNMPLTTIPEFEEDEDEENDDISYESTVQTFSQERKRSIVTITPSEEDAEGYSNQQHSLDGKEGNAWSFSKNNNDTAAATAAADISTSSVVSTNSKMTPGSGRSNRLSINLSFLSPSSPSSVSCSSFTSMSSTSPSTSSSPPSASYSSSSSAMSSPGGAMSPILNPFQWTSDMRQYIMTDIGPQPSNSQVPALRSHMHLVRQRSYSKIGGTGFGGAGLGGGLHSPSSNGGMSPLSPSSSMAKGFGTSLSSSSSPTMVRRSSLQTQALVGQYGNGNGSSLYGGVSTRGNVSLYQQRAGSSSMTDLATIPQDKTFERDLMLMHHHHHQQQQHPAATWSP